MKRLKRLQTSDEYFRREEALKAERQRNRLIQELEQASQRPTIMPSTRRWIASQIETLKSGAAAGQGGRL